MLESIVSYINIPRGFSVLRLFDDIMDKNRRKFGERIRRCGRQYLNYSSKFYKYYLYFFLVYLFFESGFCETRSKPDFNVFFYNQNLQSYNAFLFVSSFLAIEKIIYLKSRNHLDKSSRNLISRKRVFSARKRQKIHRIQSA